MAAPVVASVGANTTGTTKAINLNAPSGVSAGDLLIAAIANSSAGSEMEKVPAGWTLLQSVRSNAQDALDVYWKIASGSDSYAWEVDAGVWAGVAFRVTGHDPAAAIPTSNTSFSASAVSTLKSGTITTPRAECLVISIFGEDGDASGVGFSSAGATEFFDFQEATSFVEIAGYSETKEAAGEISRTLALAAANECSSAILAVQPPEGSVSPVRGSLNLLGVGR